MAKYAIVDGTNVVNLIVCDSKELAEEITGFAAIEIIDESDAETGGFYEDGAFRRAVVFPSWIWSKENRCYEPPTPCPISTEVAYEWNEEKLKWEAMPLA